MRPIDSPIFRRANGIPDPKPTVTTKGTSVHVHAEKTKSGSKSVSKKSKNDLPNVPSPTGPKISRSTEFGTSGSTGSASVHGTGPGGTDLSASVKGPSFSVDGSASGSISTSGVDAKVDVDLSGTAVSAEAEGKKTVNFTIAGEQYSVKLDLKAMGEIGADAHLHLDVHLGTGGIKVSASAEGFAGAKASLTGSIELDHGSDELASGSVTVGAEAGVAGSAHADVGFSGGKVSFDVGAEATAGVGLSLDVKGDVNVPNVLKAIVDTGEAAIKEGIKDGVKLVENGVGELKDLAGKGVDEAEQLAKDFGNDLEDLAKQGYDEAKDIIQDVGGTLEDIGGDVLDGLDSAIHAGGNFNPLNW
jgi:hypothetical protein